MASGTPTSPALAVALLGRFEVRAGEAVLLDRNWNRRKAKALVKLLALQRGRALHRDQVLDALWPDLDPSAAANNLHKNLHYLRAALTQHGIDPPLAALSGDVVALSPHVGVDVHEFRSRAQAARASGGPAPHPPGPADPAVRLSSAAATDPTLYEHALALYEGDLLPDDLYESWTEPDREELRLLRAACLTELSTLYEARGDLDAAAERLRQLLHADPAHEAAHRGLMRLYDRAGSRHRALRQYQQCREALQRELSVEPSAETEALYRQILDGAPSASGAATAQLVTVRTPRPAPPLPDAPRRARPEPTPYFGRDRELELADEILEAAAAGQGQALFVAGVAGIGKSRFAQQVLAAAEEQGALVLAGRSYELEAAVPYQPVREMLGQVLEHLAQADAGADDPVAQALGRSPYLKRLLPESGAERPPLVDSAVLQAELFADTARVFGALAAQQPVVLLFDDLHAADEATLRLVHALCRQLATHAILLLATYRKEESAYGRPLAHVLASLRRDRLVREVELASLPEGTLHRYVEHLFDDRPVARDLAAEITRQADGNPLFAGELVHTLRDEGLVHLADGRWARRGGAEQVPVPGAVQDLLDRRLQRLGEAARQVLHVTAILGGRDVDYSVLRRTLPLPEREVLDGLDECITAFILEETADGYRYRHNLLREGIYRRLTRARRQQLHRTVAAALAEAGADRAEQTDAVAYHFAQSDEPWRAIPYLQSAARRAAAVFAVEQAIDLYEEAVALARAHPARDEASALASLLEELADLTRRSSDAARSAHLFEEAAALLASAGEAAGVARVQGKAALAHLMSGGVETAARLLDAALRRVDEAERPAPQMEMARTYYLLAQLHWHNQRYAEARDAAEKAPLAAESSGDPVQRAQAFEVLALAAHSLGEWHKGLEYERSRQSLAVAGVDSDEAYDVHL